MTREIFGAAGVALALTMTAGAVAAQDYPTSEIRLVVPYSAGGGFDTAARMIATYMERQLGEGATILVENQPGGGGNVGIGQVYRAAPDGYTIGLVNVPGHFGQQVAGTATYDLFEMEIIGNITATNYVLTVSPQSPLQTVEDLQAADQVNVGMAGLASTDIFATMDALGINMNAIVHAGSNEAVLSAIRGDIDVIQFPVASLQGYIKEGELTALVMHAEERHPDFPDVPTIGELGHPEVLNLSMANRVLVAPPGTPDDVMTVLRDAFDAAVTDEAYVAQLAAASIDSMPGNWESIVARLEGAYEALLPYEDILRGN